jgi:hypothetical protein
MIPQEYLNFGALFVICYLLIKEGVSLVKSFLNKKNGTSETNVMDNVLKELKLQNENHLQHLNDCMNDGFDRMIKSIHDDNVKMIEILGRIDGKLSK